MGNELSSSGNVKNSLLGDYIKDFMTNRYIYNNSNQTIKENTIKKRACCLNKNEVPIALPSYYEKGKKLVPTQLIINPFKKAKGEALTDADCTFDGLLFGSSGNNNSYQTESTCRSFYGSFCNQVLDDRKKYNDIIKQSYGGYKDDPTKSGDLSLLNVGNPFPDCNCLNSIYIVQSNNIQSSVSPKAGNAPVTDITDDTRAQTFDKRCSDNIPTRSYITNWSRKENLNICINNSFIENASVSDKSDLGVNQSCQAQTSTQAQTSQTGTAPSSQTQVQNQTQTQQTDQTSQTDKTKQTQQSQTIIPSSTTSPIATTPSSDQSNTMVYVGVAFGFVILLIVVALFAFRGSSIKNSSDTDEYDED